MTRKYACYHDAIINIIGAGEANKTSLADIINHQSFVIKREHEKLPDFKKFIRREIGHLIKVLGTVQNTNQDKLIEETAGKGRAHYYFWVSSEAKNETLHKESVSDERYHARAVVFDFIEENVREFFSPEVMDNLKDDLNNSYDEFDVLGGISGKMKFIPSGIEVSPAYDITERNPEDRKLVYQALEYENVIKADYSSMHNSLKISQTESLHLSPQRVEYANHKVVLRCYIHETEKVKPFEVARLKNVQFSKKYKFKYVDFDQIEKLYDFEAIVNEGVKDYFHSVIFGKEFKSKALEDGTWKVTAKIQIPDHFSNRKQGEPDPFAMANFLMSFADSLVVIRPSFLREEMKRRSVNLAKLYSNSADRATIINRSPHEQTGNLSMAKD